jgi:hypothetical protein
VCDWLQMADVVASEEERVRLVAPIVNAMCHKFLSGGDIGGVEDFHWKLITIIRDDRLLKDNQLLGVESVGVHPDNREGAGMVASDVQDLLKIMFHKGYNRLLAKLLACEIPPSKRKQWLDFNEKLAIESDGYLPPARSSEMRVVTCQGSHTTGTIRCAKFGAKSAHACLASSDGTISSSKIIE